MLKTATDDDDVLNYQMIDIRLKELRKKLIDQLGTVVFR